jgi:uncharacterized protein (DUF1501 family)
MNRRSFAIGCSAAIAALAGGRLGRLSFANAGDPPRDTLVIVSLRGGIDGLNLVAPADDPHLAAARPLSLRVNADGPESGFLLANPLPGAAFLLHPAAAALKELYDSQALAIVHACGLVHGTRSHFEAMDLMERAAPSNRSAPGWLSRYLDHISETGTLAAVAASQYQPVALVGSPAVSMPDPASFSLPGHWKYGQQQLDTLRTVYGGSGRLHQAGRRTIGTLDTISQGLSYDNNGAVLPYEPEHGAEYPADYHAAELSVALQSVARLIKMDIGLQVATVDYGGWDTHEAQADVFPALVDGLARSLAAFYNDVARYHGRITVVVLSEFGRRLKANESAGTDHGHGNVLLALGSGINGGRMYGSWPGLAAEHLDEGADLAITTDYRIVLAEILAHRASVKHVEHIFPSLGHGQPLGIANAN